jgi:hypothetical protein
VFLGRRRLRAASVVSYPLATTVEPLSYALDLFVTPINHSIIIYYYYVLLLVIIITYRCAATPSLRVPAGPGSAPPPPEGFKRSELAPGISPRNDCNNHSIIDMNMDFPIYSMWLDIFIKLIARLLFIYFYLFYYSIIYLI